MRNKIIISVFVFIFLFELTARSNAYLTEAYSKNGFTYDTSMYNVVWKQKDYITVKTSDGDKLGVMTYLVGLARCKNTNDYVIMTKEIMTPCKEKADLGLVGKGYGMSEYVSIKTTLPSLDDYQPKNDPGSDSVNLSIGKNGDKASIGLSYEIKHNDLDITAKCSSPDKKYHIVYNYKPHMVNPLASNKYLAYESIQLGEAQFETSKKTISVKIEYDARFGAAGNKDCSPALVYVGYVKKKTGSVNYSFTIAK